MAPRARHMKVLGTLLLSLGLAANVGLFVWQLRAPSKTSIATDSGAKLVMRTPGGLLEVSTVTSEERFDATTSHTVLGVALGKTVAQIRVPAVYRYHIPLANDWRMRQTGAALVVISPPVMPSLPVAVDTAKLESLSSGMWSLVTGDEAVAALQKSITATLSTKAASPAMVMLQREAARQTVSEFVQKWVLQNPRWAGLKSPTVLVFFSDELLGKRALPLLQDAP